MLEGLSVDQDLRWVLLTALAAAGRVEEDRIAAEESADGTISGREKAAGARAARPTAEAKAAAWDAVAVRKDTPNETARSIAASFQRAGQDEVLAPYVATYLEALETMWSDLGPQKAARVSELLFPRQLASADLLETVDAWLAST